MRLYFRVKLGGRRWKSRLGWQSIVYNVRPLSIVAVVQTAVPLQYRAL
jgi:hypothetical protein